MKPPKFANVKNGKADVMFDGKIIGYVRKFGSRWSAWWINEDGDGISIKEGGVFPTEYGSRWRAVQALEMKLRGGYTYRNGSYTHWTPLSESSYMFDSNS